MGKYDNQLELLFNDWIKASKKDEYCERRDINYNTKVSHPQKVGLK